MTSETDKKLKRPGDSLSAVSEKVVYFSHQSLGYEILDGVSQLTGPEGGIRIVESERYSDAEETNVLPGNPAQPVAICGIPLLQSTPYWEFHRSLRPIRRSQCSMNGGES